MKLSNRIQTYFRLGNPDGWQLLGLLTLPPCKDRKPLCRAFLATRDPSSSRTVDTEPVGVSDAE